MPEPDLLNKDSLHRLANDGLRWGECGKIGSSGIIRHSKICLSSSCLEFGVLSLLAS